MGHTTPFTERGSYSGLVPPLTERIKIGSGSHRNMAIFEVFSTRTTGLGISESYVARRSSHAFTHMLSQSPSGRYILHPQCPQVTKEKLCSSEIGLTESSKDKKSAFDCCKPKKIKLEQPFFFTYTVPPGDKFLCLTNVFSFV
jgi:hypothetical protein